MNRLTREYLYVLADFSTNQVDSRGIGLVNFQRAMQRPIKNILLLSGDAPEAEYDEYTRFFVIRGEAAVSTFFRRQLEHPDQSVKWVDYVSDELLHQLTPAEIAELLYLRHMTRSWHSPFFYKLRNDYAYLPKPNDMLRVYYRRISEFLNQLSYRLAEMVASRETEGISRYFSLIGGNRQKKKLEVKRPGREVMEQLRPLLSEGIVIDFSNVHYRTVTTMPLYLVADRSADLFENSIAENEQIGYLSYDATSGEWQLETTFEGDDFGG